MPPSKRSSIAQSVGPMTAVISLTRQRGQEKFESRWENAIKRSMSHFPDINDFIKGIKNKKASEVREVVRAAADLALVTETREARRASFPWNALSLVLLSKRQIVYYMTKDLDKLYLNAEDTDADIPLLNQINYSGKGTFKVYKAIGEYRTKLKMPNTMSSDIASQIAFHKKLYTTEQRAKLRTMLKEDKYKILCR
jgi:hypothetical protein